MTTAIVVVVALLILVGIVEGPAKPAPKPRSKGQSAQPARSSPAGLNTALTEVNERLEEIAAVRQAVAALGIHLHGIAVRIDSAMESAERERKIEAYLGNDPDRRRAFDENSQRLGAALARVGPKPSPLLPIDAADFPAALAKVSGPHAAAIRDRLQSMQDEHEKRLAAARQRLARSPDLRVPFQRALTKLNGAGLLPLLMPAPPKPAPTVQRADAPAPPVVATRRPAAPLAAARTAIREAAVARGVGELFHFTTLQNLEPILQHGLRGSAWRRALGIEAATNDAERLDGFADATCLSVGFPNHRLLHSFRYRDRDARWVILRLSPAILWEKPCAFHRRNAAHHLERDEPLPGRMTVDAFETMFADQPPGMRDGAGLLASDPTDVQAEVLVFGPIEPDYITGVLFDDPQTQSRCRALLRGREAASCGPYDGLFGTRDRARATR